MNEGTRKQLDIKLKEMLNQLDEAKVKQNQSTLQPGIGNTIRRRKGQKDKRFSV